MAVVHAKHLSANNSAALTSVHASNWNDPHGGTDYTFTQTLQFFGPCFSPEVGPIGAPGRYKLIGPAADANVKKYFWKRNAQLIAAMFEVCWIPVAVANQVVLAAFTGIVGGEPTSIFTIGVITGQDVSTPVLSQVSVLTELLFLDNNQDYFTPNLIGFLVTDQDTAWKLFEVRLQLTYQVTQ